MNSMYLLGFMLNTLVQNYPVDRGLQFLLFVPTLCNDAQFKTGETW